MGAIDDGKAAFRARVLVPPYQEEIPLRRLGGVPPPGILVVVQLGRDRIGAQDAQSLRDVIVRCRVDLGATVLLRAPRAQESSVFNWTRGTGVRALVPRGSAPADVAWRVLPWPADLEDEWLGW
jgi:hypothetical protein